MITESNTLLNKYMDTVSVSKNVAYKFLEDIISQMVDPYGLLYEDGTLEFIYEPRGTSKMFKKILSTNFSEILSFLGIKFPKPDEYRMIKVRDLYDCVINSRSFNPDIYNLQILNTDIPFENTLERRLRYFFYSRTRKIKEKNSDRDYFLYPIDDILVNEIINYNFPDKKIKKFINALELKYFNNSSLTYLGPSIIMTWIPELRDKRVQDINNLANAFKEHINIIYKKDYSEYVEGVDDKELRNEFIQFYIDTK